LLERQCSNLGQLDACACRQNAEGLAEIITDFFNRIDPKRTLVYLNTPRIFGALLLNG